VIESFEDYKRYVDKYNRLPGGFGGNLKKVLSEVSLEKKFNSYVKRNMKKEEKRLNAQTPFSSKDLNWVNLKNEIWEVDHGECQLLASLKVLSKDDPEFEKIYLYAKKQYNPDNTLDSAHIIPRSFSKTLQYDLENVVLLQRIFHSRIDFGKNPLTGDPCSKQEIREWWDIILTVRSRKFKKSLNTDYLLEKDIKLRQRRNYG